MSCPPAQAAMIIERLSILKCLFKTYWSRKHMIFSVIIWVLLGGGSVKKSLDSSIIKYVKHVISKRILGTFYKP